MNADLLVIAKEPLPGRSKTRLTPPLTPEDAASLAGAALADTLLAAAAVPARRRILALEGTPGAWLPAGFEAVAQSGGGLDVRLADAFAESVGPALLIGMDTPQVSPGLLEVAMDALCSGPHDALIGPAFDGGWWALGLKVPSPDVFMGVPMSTAGTYAAQVGRLGELGLGWAELPALRDVDEIDDAHAVAAEAPGSHFSARLAEISPA
jgi:uncharacterized protein